MNLAELDQMLKRLDEVKDAGIIAFYLKKRKVLVKTIFKTITKKVNTQKK